MATIDEDESHRMLSSDRRRLLIDLLAEQPPSVDLDTLAAQLFEEEAAAGDVKARSVEQVSISLHHSHLPKLDSVGVIDYEPGSKTVEIDHGSLLD